MVKIFGIKTCDACRNALKYLDENNIEHQFFDLRDGTLNREMIERWAFKVGWKSLLNRRSKTWRGLLKEKAQCLDVSQAVELMLENPTVIKRPIFDLDDTIYIGLRDQQLLFLKS